MAKILVVEDDPQLLAATRRFLGALGHEVVGSAPSGEEGVTLVREARPDLVLLDIGLAGEMDGVSAAEVILTELHIPVLFVSANDDDATLRRVAALGSPGFVLKPFNSAQLRASIEVALRSHQLRDTLRPNAPSPPDPSLDSLAGAAPPGRAAAHVLLPTSRGKIIGRHPRIREALDIVTRVAASDATVLVTGESGTGKELIAAALHDGSPRAQAPLVVINCGAIPENLLEAELFGHAKGAFTGAAAARQGLIAAAEKGTLLLDEIGEMPLLMQVRLLRLVQQREYTPLGSTKEVKCDVRIVAATNRDLEKEVADGRFREDLYYRLNVVRVELPPLRERRDDIPDLAHHFFQAALTRNGRGDLTGFSDEAMAALVRYGWPGNIRSLQNVVERTALLARGPRVEVADLPPQLRGVTPAQGGGVRAAELGDAGIDLRAAVEDYEAILIRQALKRTNNNKNRAAQLLGLNRTTLVEMMKRKHIV
jgi:DNA-binding NtrC family response regulator